MNRAILKCLIGWYADSDRAVPTWLRRRMEQDTALGHYADEWARLEKQLKQDAPANLATGSARVPAAAQDPRRTIDAPARSASRPACGELATTSEPHGLRHPAMRIALTLAASLLVIATGWFIYSRGNGSFRPPTPARAPQQSVANAEATQRRGPRPATADGPAEQSPLAPADSRTALGPAPLPGSRTELTPGTPSGLTQDQQRWVRDLLAHEWRRPWQAASIDRQRLVQSVDNIKSQPKAMAADFERAVAFFARDLPLCTARVMGLASAAPPDPSRLLPENAP